MQQDSQVPAAAEHSQDSQVPQKLSHAEVPQDAEHTEHSHVPAPADHSQDSQVQEKPCHSKVPQNVERAQDSMALAAHAEHLQDSQVLGEPCHSEVPEEAEHRLDSQIPAAAKHSRDSQVPQKQAEVSQEAEHTEHSHVPEQSHDLPVLEKPCHPEVPQEAEHPQDSQVPEKLSHSQVPNNSQHVQQLHDAQIPFELLQDSQVLEVDSQVPEEPEPIQVAELPKNSQVRDQKVEQVTIKEGSEDPGKQSQSKKVDNQDESNVPQLIYMCMHVSYVCTCNAALKDCTCMYKHTLYKKAGIPFSGRCIRDVHAWDSSADSWPAVYGACAILRDPGCLSPCLN